MNRRDFYPSQFTSGTGKTDYVVDVPDGDCQVDIDVRSSKPHTVYLHNSPDPDVAPVVFSHGTSSRCTFNVAGLAFIRISTEKTAVISYRVQHRLRKMSDPINDEIVSLPMPPPQVPLATLVSRAVGERLAELTGEKNPQIDLEELIDDLPDDVDPEFGPGAMEMDQDFEERWRARGKEKAGRKDAADPKPAAGDSADSKRVRDVPEARPQPEPDARIAQIEKLLVELKAGN